MLRAPIPKNDDQEIKAVYQALKDQKDALDQHSIVAITDVAGKIIYVNDKFCQISQYFREELLGQDHRIINSGYHSKDFMKNMWRTIASGKVWKGEIRNKAKDGTFYWVDSTIVPFVNNQGKPYEYVAIRTDITQKKNVEFALMESKADLEKMNQALRKVDQQKDDFVSNVSHELRTPLTVIKESVRQVIDGILGPVTENQMEILNMARRNVDRLANIINDLLDISRIEKGKIELNKTLTDIVGLANEVAAGFEIQAMVKKLRIKKDFSRQNIKVFIDRGRVIQIFNNLLSNAVKFTDAGSISISIVEDQEWVICSVEDTGKGILPDDLKKMFSKFEQFGRQDGPGAKGTGLGLSICKALVELHGGFVKVESIFQKGTKFIFSFPILTSQEIVLQKFTEVYQEAKKENLPFVFIRIGLKGLDQLLEKENNDRIKKFFDELAGVLQKSLFRRRDCLLKDQQNIYILFPETKIKDKDVLLKRFQAVIKEECQDCPWLWDNLSFLTLAYPEDIDRLEEYRSLI